MKSHRYLFFEDFCSTVIILVRNIYSIFSVPNPDIELVLAKAPNSVHIDSMPDSTMEHRNCTISGVFGFGTVFLLNNNLVHRLITLLYHFSALSVWYIDRSIPLARLSNASNLCDQRWTVLSFFPLGGHMLPVLTVINYMIWYWSNIGITFIAYST